MADEIRTGDSNAMNGGEGRDSEHRHAEPRDLGSRREFEASDVARANEPARRPEPIGDRSERHDERGGMLGRMRHAWDRIRGRD